MRRNRSYVLVVLIVWSLLETLTGSRGFCAQPFQSERITSIHATGSTSQDDIASPTLTVDDSALEQSRILVSPVRSRLDAMREAVQRLRARRRQTGVASGSQPATGSLATAPEATPASAAASASASVTATGGFGVPRIFLMPPKQSEKPTPATQPDSSIKTSCLPSASSSAQTKRYVINLPNWLCKTLTFFGAKCPVGTKVVIIVRPKQTSQPVPVPPTPTPTPVPGGNSKTQAAYMQAQFGITPKSGSNAVWSQAQLEAANKVLATLPASFRSATKSIQRDVAFNGKSGVLGWVQMGNPTVHLTNAACKVGVFEGTLVHEMTHTFQAANPQVAKDWEKTFWPLGKWIGPIPRSVTSYGNTEPLEDMAESVRLYWENGAWMKKNQPKRYEFIKTQVMAGKEFL